MQPDTESFDGCTLYEIKLHRIGAHARVQSSIFAYVWERSFKLVVLIEETGRYGIEVETIQPL